MAAADAKELLDDLQAAGSLLTQLRGDWDALDAELKQQGIKLGQRLRIRNGLQPCIL